jgi:hypothetical protein
MVKKVIIGSVTDEVQRTPILPGLIIRLETRKK